MIVSRGPAGFVNDEWDSNGGRGSRDTKNRLISLSLPISVLTSKTHCETFYYVTNFSWELGGDSVLFLFRFCFCFWSGLRG